MAVSLAVSLSIITLEIRTEDGSTWTEVKNLVRVIRVTDKN